MLVIKEYSITQEYDNLDEVEFNELENEYEIDDTALFVYDGCHKIYIVEDEDDIANVKECWGEDEKFYKLEELPKIWSETCPLRFISNWKLDRQQYVRQFYGAEFEWK